MYLYGQAAHTCMKKGVGCGKSAVVRGRRCKKSMLTGILELLNYFGGGEKGCLEDALGRQTAHLRQAIVS